MLLVWVISPKLNGTHLFNLEPNMSNDFKWTTLRKDLYMWWIRGMIHSTFFKSPLIMNCTGCSSNSATMFTRCALTVNTVLKNLTATRWFQARMNKIHLRSLHAWQFTHASLHTDELKMMKWQQTMEQVAITTAKHEPSVEKEIQRSDYAKSMDMKSPKLYEDKAQSSKIQSND